jgi:hypothetical protein
MIFYEILAPRATNYPDQHGSCTSSAADWFSRGWTLQELIAPSAVVFFASDCQRLGDKRSLEQEIKEVTHIPIPVLRGESLLELSIEERMSWSKGRQIKKPEDKAYSLLGLFSIHMLPNYGDGEIEAFQRLEIEIYIRQNNTTGDPQLDTSLNQCLSDLRVTDPRDDKLRIESTKGGLINDSYRWILEHKDFQQWNGNNNQLLWIKGDPGKGKTMLLCGIVHELNSLPPNERLLSYLFCQATDTNLNSAAHVLQGLIYMLVKQDRSLLKHVHEEWKVAGKAIFEDANSWQALLRIFTIRKHDVARNHEPRPAMVQWWNSSNVYVKCPFCSHIHYYRFTNNYSPQHQQQRISHCFNENLGQRRYCMVFPFPKATGESNYEINRDRSIRHCRSGPFCLLR